MTFSGTCEECNRKVAIEYDEDDSTPVFCPFCGEEWPETAGDFRVTPQEEPLDDDFDFENF